MEHRWDNVCEYLGIGLGDGQRVRLRRYRDLLREEAIPAGGLGSGELERLDERHVADSLLFAKYLIDSDGPVLDVGTGVGLPGIPLAIMCPSRHFTLIDRSGRRADLVRRALRILDLENVDVEQRDFAERDGQWPAVVSRAALDPSAHAAAVRRVIAPGGLAVFGGSWVDPPDVTGWVTEEVGRNVLDRDVWILIMRRL